LEEEVYKILFKAACNKYSSLEGAAINIDECADIYKIDYWDLKLHITNEAIVRNNLKQGNKNFLSVKSVETYFSHISLEFRKN
jgi:hypothetical protein